MKDISKESVRKLSYKLYKRRKAQNLTVYQIANSLKIRAHFISYIEKGMWHLLPKGITGRSMIRSYAEFLNVDMTRITDKYRTLDEKKTQDLYAIEDIQFVLNQKKGKEKGKRYSKSLKVMPLSLGPRLSQWPLKHMEKELAGPRAREKMVKVAVAAVIGIFLAGSITLFNSLSEPKPVAAKSLILDDDRYSYLSRRP